MKSFKKIVLLTGCALLVTGLLLKELGHDESAAPTEQASSFNADGYGIYAVDISVSQVAEGQDEVKLLNLKGKLQQGMQAANEWQTTWTEISQAEMLGKDSKEGFKALLNKPILTIAHAQDASLEHLMSDFPAQLQALQASILQKIIVPREALKGGRSPFLLSEKDEVGAFNAQYTLLKSASSWTLEKQWLTYKQLGIRVDPAADKLIYKVSPSGKVQSIEGTISLHYSMAMPTRYTTQIEVRLLPDAVAAHSSVPLQKAGLKKLNLTSPPVSAADSDQAYTKTREQLAQIKESSSGTEVYQIFSELKQALNSQPERASELVQAMLAIEARDAAAKRQLSVMFGALAQSESPQTLEQLSELMKQCPDQYCRIQALVAISDHKHPSVEAAERVLILARSAQDQETAGTALLTAGSIGQKLGQNMPEIASFLRSELQNPKRQDMQSTVLAAMGNHGDPSYLEILRERLAAPESNVRAAATYSLRSMPQAEGDRILLQVLNAEKDKDVLAEAYKAIEYRDLSAADYQSLAQISAARQDEGLQQAAARTLLNAYRDHPAKLEAAVELLLKQTNFANVRAYIESEYKVAH